MMNEFFETLGNLCDDNLDDEAWKFVADSICDLAEGGMVEEVDTMLASLDVFKFRNHPEVLLAFLNSTVVFKDLLSRRESVRRAIETELVQTFGSDMASKLLVDL